ncbi:DUF1127 domain-containing protein [Bradyrhizobium sp. RDT46]|uniref:DUF1127 domain-containing protein n=1 Tax=Bradyrhizobium sp. RDT46 TaxID=3341829 RepID=UPI0035C677D2
MDDVAFTARPCPSRLALFVRMWRTLVELARARRQRSRARRQLAAMTERELQDCGTTRAEIGYELKKPVRRK